METLQELEKQYNEAKKQMNWQLMAAIMLKVYPENQEPPKQKKAETKRIESAQYLNYLNRKKRV